MPLFKLFKQKKSSKFFWQQFEYYQTNKKQNKLFSKVIHLKFAKEFEFKRSTFYDCKLHL